MRMEDDETKAANEGRMERGSCQLQLVLGAWTTVIGTAVR